MGNRNLPDDGTAVNADDITWALDPPPPLEDADLLVLDDDELRAYVQDLREEIRWLRRLLHACLAQLHIVTSQLTAARRTIRELRRQEHHG